MVTPKEHAARLRLLKNCLGMLRHSDSALVFDDDPKAEKAVFDTINIIRNTTPVSDEDCLDYELAAIKEIHVIRTDNGLYKFSRSDGDKRVTLKYTETSIPKC